MLHGKFIVKIGILLILDYFFLASVSSTAYGIFLCKFSVTLFHFSLSKVVKYPLRQQTFSVKWQIEIFLTLWVPWSLLHLNSAIVVSKQLDNI